MQWIVRSVTEDALMIPRFACLSLTKWSLPLRTTIRKRYMVQSEGK